LTICSGRSQLRGVIFPAARFVHASRLGRRLVFCGTPLVSPVHPSVASSASYQDLAAAVGLAVARADFIGARHFAIVPPTRARVNPSRPLRLFGLSCLFDLAHELMR
jgi:hypothetical protein